MSLREEMWKYEEITGESAEHVPIIKLGAFLDGYEMGLKALEQRWIPVSERLPEDKQGCIVTVQGDSKTFIDIVTYYAEEHSFLYYEECNVLAWMPLPEPYKAESEKDVCKDCYYNDGEVHAECVMCDKSESEDKE